MIERVKVREFLSTRTRAIVPSPLLPESASHQGGAVPLRQVVSIEELVASHADFVWRSLRRLGVPESAADDAVQQVFLVAASKVEDIRAGSERAFLFTTLRNIAAHVRRSMARSRELPGVEACSVEPADPSPAADDLVAERQARALLDEVLDGLPLDLRTVFVLFELEELSAPEVAELTGLPVGTVASRLRRARSEFQRVARRVQARAAQGSRGKP